MCCFEVGGQEVVTATLANCFVKHGYNVIIVSFKSPNETMMERVNKEIDFFTLGEFKESKKNVAKLREIFINHHINVVINQWGLPFIPIRVINKARKGLKLKVISVYHNQVDTNARIMAINQTIIQTECVFLRLFLKLKRKVVKIITSQSMRYVYYHSDIYEVLSPSFVELFKQFTGIRNPDKLVVQTNPITIVKSENTDINDIIENKQKEILYVGRLDNVQKKVQRVLDSWNYLEDKYPDWQLSIVGDGENRENLENHAKDLGLKRVSFEGFKQPVDYYKRASILMLTSDFEGFPLVLAECMSFGVIPAVYHSYAAVDDIIEDGKDGIILPYCKDGFYAEDMAKKLSLLMNDEQLRNSMALAAIRKSENYSVERIFEEWEKLFENQLKLS